MKKVGTTDLHLQVVGAGVSGGSLSRRGRRRGRGRFGPGGSSGPPAAAASCPNTRRWPRSASSILPVGRKPGLAGLVGSGVEAQPGPLDSLLTAAGKRMWLQYWPSQQSIYTHAVSVLVGIRVQVGQRSSGSASGRVLPQHHGLSEAVVIGVHLEAPGESR